MVRRASDLRSGALARSETAPQQVEELLSAPTREKKNRAARAYTRKFFEDLGYKVPQCEANFMLVDIRRDAKEFKMACVNQLVAIGRQFTTLPNHARVSIGTMEEMKKAARVFKATLAQSAANTG